MLTKDNIVGLKHVFEDGDSICVVQVKSRNAETHLVTYHIQQGPGIPRKHVMEFNEFLGTYGHLFGVDE